MKYEITSFQTLIQNFFLQRMMQQRKVSAETVHSYRDTFRIFLLYMQEKHGKQPDTLDIQDFNLKNLQDFCKYLEVERGNKPVTINNRIAALKSFLH